MREPDYEEMTSIPCEIDGCSDLSVFGICPSHWAKVDPVPRHEAYANRLLLTDRANARRADMLYSRLLKSASR
jgi:hypothetical protein